MIEQTNGLNRAHRRMIEAMGAAITSGSKLLVVVVQKSQRTPSFYRAMLGLVGSEGIQITLTGNSRKKSTISSTLTSTPGCTGMLVTNGERLTAEDQGFLAALKDTGKLPTTIIVTAEDPGNLMDRKEQTGPWSTDFVIKTVSRTFHWPTTQQTTTPQPAPTTTPTPTTQRDKQHKKPPLPRPPAQEPLQLRATG